MSMQNINKDSECEELCPSELGTKEYWDKTYTDGIKNFKDSGVIDEGWFGEDSMVRVVKWLCSDNAVKKNDRIIDIGCGNGNLLLELANEGFINLTGVDYSANAIELARAIATEKNVSINFENCDILSDNLQLDTFNIALDKGTYDAISLHGNAKEMRHQYISSVWKLLKTNGKFVITSCNWTEKELVAHFISEFSLHHVIPTPTFKFGGMTGNVVTSLVFQKRELCEMLVK